MKRTDNTLSALTAQAQRDLQELKDMQIFGGDSLRVEQWTSEVLADDPLILKKYLVRLEPLADTGVLPCKAELLYPEPTSYDQVADKNFTVDENAVFDGTGSFEWVVQGYRYQNYETKVRLQWIGKGKVTIKEI